LNRELTLRLILLTLLISAIFLAACRRQEASGSQTVLSTLPPTPRSTPLPAVPTAIPIGAEGNPLRMVIRPDGSMSSARIAIADFEAAVLQQSGIAVQVELVERYAEAVAALCGSSSGQMSVAWLDGASYFAANAQNCGIPVLQVERGLRQNARTGEAASIIVNADANISTISALRDRSFCRLSYDDFYTWLAPVLILKASGLDSVTDINAILDYEDLPSMIQAVASRDCDAAGIPAGALDLYADDLGDAVDEIEVLTTSVDFPYAILTMPADLPLGTRIALTEALVAIAGDRETAVKMRDLLGQNAILPVTSDDFTDLEEFMTNTNLDFSQLGS
jgi:ABC-type phosphate/phosphonate transport system substrate-binding protein